MFKVFRSRFQKEKACNMAISFYSIHKYDDIVKIVIWKQIFVSTISFMKIVDF